MAIGKVTLEFRAPANSVLFILNVSNFQKTKTNNRNVRFQGYRAIVSLIAAHLNEHTCLLIPE